MKIDFKNKIVVVTGATRGIGKNIAESFYALGAALLVTGTNQKQINALNSSLKRNSRIRYFYLDFLNEDSVMKFLSEINDYKKIDVCVNNAGINRINYIYETKLSDWDQIMQVNLRGPFLLSQAVARIMKKNRWGRIINIASIFGVVTKEKRSVYTASKSGLIGLTKTAAIDLAGYNILVNSVSPGFILTDLTKKILSGEEIKKIRHLIPLRRFGKPEDVSSMVLFLASDLNNYLTGQNIIIDGGYVNL